MILAIVNSLEMVIQGNEVEGDSVFFQKFSGNFQGSQGISDRRAEEEEYSLSLILVQSMLEHQQGCVHRLDQVCASG